MKRNIINGLIVVAIMSVGLTACGTSKQLAVKSKTEAVTKATEKETETTTDEITTVEVTTAEATTTEVTTAEVTTVMETIAETSQLVTEQQEVAYVEPETEAYVEPQPQPETEAYVEPQPQPETEAYVEPQPQPETEAYVEPQPQPETEAYVEPQPQPETEQYTGSIAEMFDEPIMCYDMLEYVNEARRGYGLKELFWDSSIEYACKVRVKELGQSYDHKRPDGKSLDELFSMGIKDNLAKGWCATQREVFDTWMNSRGHANTILNDCTEDILVDIDTLYNPSTGGYYNKGDVIPGRKEGFCCVQWNGYWYLCVSIYD